MPILDALGKVYRETGLWVPQPLRMVQRRCCCGCVYFTDDFNRDNNSDLGDNWTETTGDWSIASNKLSISSSNAVVTCDKTNPSGTAVVAIATLAGVAEGDQLRILVDYVDSSNYWFGEIEWGPADGTGALRLWHRSGGTNTLKGRTVLAGAIVGGSAIELTVCIGDGVISAVVSSVILVANATQSTSNTGLATGTVDGAVTFDDFSLSKHETDNAECPACADKPCQYFYDDFDRTNNADLGDDWDEVAGAWSINGEYLETSSATAECSCECDEPEGNDAAIATVSAKATAVGDQLQLSLNGCYIQVELKAASKADVKVFCGGVQKGSTTEISLALNTFITLFICVDNSYVAAGAGSAYFHESATATDSTVALKTGTLTGTATFNNAIISRHGSTLPGCPCYTVPCGGCSPNTAPQWFKVEISGIVDGAGCPTTGTCTEPNGTYIVPFSTNLGTYCWWVMAGLGSGVKICHHIWGILIIIHSNGLIEVTGGVSYGGREIRWSGSFGPTPLDCSSFNALSIPWSFDNLLGICDGSNSTCKITSL